MLVVLIVACALVSAMFFEDWHFTILGAVIGWLIGVNIALKKQLLQLQRKLDFLAGSVNQNGLDQRPVNQEQPAQILSAQEIRPDSSAQININEHIHAAIDEHANDVSMLQYGSEQVAIKNSSVEQSESIPSKDEATDYARDRSEHQHTESNKLIQPKPDIFDRAFAFAKNWPTTGNPAVKVGAIILFFGVAFLFKFAAEKGLFAVEYRVIATAIAATALLIFGWRIREREDNYGLLIQATAVGVLYMTVFAAFRLYQLISPTIAFPLLVVVSVVAGWLAIKQNSRSVALLAISGGFLAPVLASTGQGSHIALFSYYAVLNLGIFAIAWFKSWRLLNLTGFVFTFAIGGIWGVARYQSDWLLSTELFLNLFFVMYSLLAVLYANKQPPRLKGYVDGTLVFGLPVIFFSLQAGLLDRFEYGLAYCALATASYYLLLALFIKIRGSSGQRLLFQSFVALTVIFFSLAIPLALSGEWTASAWAIEGAGLLWLGLQQQRWFPKYFGILLQAGGAFIFLLELAFGHHQPTFWAPGMGIWIVAIAAIFSAWLFRTNSSCLTALKLTGALGKIDQIIGVGRSDNISKASNENHQPIFSYVFLVAGLLWWYPGNWYLFDEWQVVTSPAKLWLLFPSLTAIGWMLLAVFMRWNVLIQLRWLWLILILFSAAIGLDIDGHLLVKDGRWIWPFALVLYFASWRYQDKLKIQEQGNAILHLLSFAGMLTIVALELRWQLIFQLAINTQWLPVIFAIYVFAAQLFVVHWNRWPLSAHRESYGFYAMGILSILLILWQLRFNFLSPAEFEGVSYLPILNPVDGLTVMMTGYILWLTRAENYQRIARLNQWPERLENRMRYRALATFGLIWITVIVLRSIHHWYGVDWHLKALMASDMVQTSLSILWGLLGLIGAVLGNRLKIRFLWSASAALLGLVVLKLFVFDLANSGTVERIVSFIGVGVLLLVVGYFAPLPVKEKNEGENVWTVRE